MIPVNHLEGKHARLEAQVLRWAARIISTATAAYWSLILIVIEICDLISGCSVFSWENELLALLVTVSVLSVVFAWQREAPGGVFMALWGSLFIASWWRWRTATA